MRVVSESSMTSTGARASELGAASDRRARASRRGHEARRGRAPAAGCPRRRATRPPTTASDRRLRGAAGARRRWRAEQAIDADGGDARRPDWTTTADQCGRSRVGARGRRKRPRQRHERDDLALVDDRVAVRASARCPSFATRSVRRTASSGTDADASGASTTERGEGRERDGHADARCRAASGLAAHA